MISAEQQVIDFDGILTTASGATLPCTCKLKLPDGTWQATEIDIGLAQVGMRQHLQTPLGLFGTDRTGRSIKVSDIYYHSIYFEPSRKTGLAKMDIKLVGEVEVTHVVLPNPIETKLNISLSNSEYLRSAHPASVESTDKSRIEELFMITLPVVGKATFLRQWRFWRNVDNVTSKGACSFILELSDASTALSEFSSRSPFLSALVVPSIFMRQRIAVNGWEEQGEVIKEVIRQPMEPILPKSYSIPPDDYLVREPKLIEVIEQACRAFSRLSSEMQQTVEKMALGLVPFNKLGHEERFRTMFYGLESCRKFASKIPSPEILQARDEVLVALKSAHEQVNGRAAQRLQGFIQSVETGPKVDLRIQLEEVLENWKVVTHDLWPLFGNDMEPGLVKIRDKLSHSGSSSVNSESLVLATYHMSLLIERVVLAILGIPLDETLVSPESLQIDPWHARDRILSARRGTFIKTD